jgi:hypothetical protein
MVSGSFPVLAAKLKICQMKKFLFYAGAIALGIASFAVISAFKARSAQDEDAKYIIVRSFQNFAVGEKSYFVVCYGPDKSEVVECEYEQTQNGIKERQERRIRNTQLINSTFQKIGSMGYHLVSSSSDIPMQMVYVFEK